MLSYYRAKVYRYIVQFVKNNEIADDLTQDMMIKVWNRRERLLLLDDADNYILKMAKNHVIDHFKRLAKEKVYQGDIWYLLQKTSSPADTKLIQKDINTRLIAVIKSLPSRQQEIYKLSKYDGLPLYEIAKMLDIKPRTVRNHLDRALKVIRSQMSSDLFLLLIIPMLSRS